MCRLVAYLGPPRTLEALLYAPPAGLLVQSYAAKRARGGPLNGDGWGVGWYDRAHREEPARYRTARPMWTDRAFQSVAGVVASGAVLAAVRSATPPLPVEESGAPPFVSGRWLFALNGSIERFRAPESGVHNALAARVSPRRHAEVEGVTDSELLFALVLDRLDAGESGGAALRFAIAETDRVSGGALNLMLTDGRRVWATARGNSLVVREADGGVTVASEVADDAPGWREVSQGSLIEAAPGDVRITPIAAI